MSGDLVRHRFVLRAARWVALLCRLLLGGIFLYAGIIKAGASEEFALALIPFSIVPEAWTGPLAVGLAWTEIAAGFLVLLPWFHRIGAVLILALTLLFSGVLAWALAHGIIVSCGCFGEDAAPSAAAMQLAILRDIALFAAALFVLGCPTMRAR